MPIAAFTPTLDRNPGKTVHVSRGRVKPKSKDPNAYNIGTSQAVAWELRKLSGICLLNAARPRLFSTESVSGMGHETQPRADSAGGYRSRENPPIEEFHGGFGKAKQLREPSRRRAFDPETLWLSRFHYPIW